MLLGTLVLFAAASVLSTTAQTTEADLGAHATPTETEVANAIQEAERAPDLDDALKARVVELYRQAEAALGTAKRDRGKIRAIRDAIDSGPQERSAHASVAKPPASVQDLGIAVNADRQVLEQHLTQTQSAHATLLERQAGLERRLEALSVLPREAPERLELMRTRRAELESAMTAPTPDGANSRLRAAQGVAQRAQLWAIDAAIALLNQELLSQDIRYKRLLEDQDALKQAVDVSQSTVDLLSAHLIERRQQEATRSSAQAEQTRIEARDMHPALGAVAERNAELTRQIEDLVANEGQVRVESTRLKRRIERIEDDLKRYEQRLEIAGLNRVLGKLFIERRKRLVPRTSFSTIDDASLERRIVAAGLGQLEVDEERADLGDGSQLVDHLLREVNGSGAGRRERASAAVSELVEQQVDLLKQLQSAYATRGRHLGEIEADRRRYDEVLTRFEQFLDVNLLWIPNLERIDWRSVVDLGRVAGSLALPSSWWTPIAYFLEDFTQSPFAYLLALGAVAFVLYLRRRAHPRIRELNERVGHLHTDRFANTLRAGLIVLAKALVWPVLLAMAGWRLGVDSQPGSAPAAVGELLGRIALALFPLSLMRALCADEGLAEVHFRWTRRAIGIVRRQLARFTAFLIPLMCIGSDGPWVSEEVHASVSRLALIVLAIVLSYTMYRLINPIDGALADKLRVNLSSLLNRTRWLWLPLVTLIPLVLAILAALGYQFTAVHLLRDYYLSIWLVALAYIVHEFGVRWLELAAARMAWRERIATMRDVGAGEQHGEGAEAEDPVVINFEAVNQQSLRLFSSVITVLLASQLWAIWSDLLPALGVLDDVLLWDYTEEVAGQPIVRHITLANLVIAAAMAFLFAIAVPSLPRLLELAVYQRIQFTAGTLNAITTVMRYVLTALGIVLVFNTLGVGWSKVQWLVAAVSVGLGFGLQEIFANFVSGLILLFERPVRIGDTVTIGGVNGTVTRIRIRATTIRDWDNKEIVVPNKTLITNDLTNWSLSDATVRIVLRVGIAYGSDTELAHATMLKVADELPSVLKAPPPSVFFVGLGDSSLDFEVRLFVPAIADMFTTRHAYYMGVEKALTAAGIDIPFPQRDIRIRPAPDSQANPRSHPLQRDDAEGPSMA